MSRVEHKEIIRKKIFNVKKTCSKSEQIYFTLYRSIRFILAECYKLQLKVFLVSFLSKNYSLVQVMLYSVLRTINEKLTKSKSSTIYVLLTESSQNKLMNIISFTSLLSQRLYNFPIWLTDKINTVGFEAFLKKAGFEL